MTNTELLPCPFYVVVIDEVPYVFSNLKDAENFTFGYKYPQRILMAHNNTRAPIPAPVGDVDLDNAREVFEKWITANGDYPHLKHKSFGGNYLHEEVAMKWDGFRAGYYTQPKQSAPVERIEGLNEAITYIEKLKTVRDALTDCRVATKTGCTEHALAFSMKALAVLDTIIADHIPDACKIDVPALNELEHRLVNLGNTLDYNKSYPRKNITEEVDLIIKQFRTLRSNLSAAPQPPTKGD